MTEEDHIVGVKALTIKATVRYPVVSAYEFEFLKEEAAVKQHLEPCTLYVIIQRPLLVINNLHGKDGVIHFTIDDDTPSAPLECEINLVEAGFLQHEGEEFELEMQFFRPRDRDNHAFNELACFKIFDCNGSFKVWFSAQRFIYHYLEAAPGFSLAGDVTKYIDYTVHYIGKAFNQAVWERLTGHEKMQKVLTMERSKNVRSLGAPFEISLMLIAITDALETYQIPYMGWPLIEDPILHPISTDAEMERFLTPWVTEPTVELTNEFEAKLISELKPDYNQTQFSKYPYIASGARSLGYSICDLQITMMPAILQTRHAKLVPFMPTQLGAAVRAD